MTLPCLPKEQQESCENAKICYICRDNFENKYFKDKKYCKVRDHCHYTCHYTWECRGAGHSLCNLKYSYLKKTPIVFHYGFNYVYHFIIKALIEKFKK